LRLPVPEVIPPASELGRVHFVGIGGAGLSAIARIMAQQGVPVSGSDDQDTPFLPSLRELGIPLASSYAAEHVAGADTLVVTTAASDDNPEVREGRARGLRLLPRSAGLKATMAGHQVLAVAGTHGKTTATSMLTMALRAAGADPTYAIGGVLAATGRNADSGDGSLFVAEADESDGAFLVYRPQSALVTNVDADHLDVWGTEEAYHAAFAEFAETVETGGTLVVCADDPGGAALAAAAGDGGRLHVVTVGTGPEHDVRLTGLEIRSGSSSFALLDGGRSLGRVHLQVPGRHYALDAAGALTLGLRLGFAFDDLARGLADFTGTGRRMESLGSAGGVQVYDSYAHHPVEIAGDLEAARALAGGGRLVVAFQPHLVSRTRAFGPAMGQALGAADEVVVLDVYVAREQPDPAVTGAVVADAVPLPAERVHYVPDLGAVAGELARLARPGDLVLTLGAGSVTTVGPQVLSALGQAGGAGR
jgi:UDP-N-acetylmuramate--alanine ligase